MGWRGWALAVGVLISASCAPRERAPVAAPAPSGAAPVVAVLPFRVGGALDPNATFEERRDIPPIPDDIGERIAVTLSQQLARNGVPTVDPAAVLRATPPAGATRYDAQLATRVARAVKVQLV